MYRSLILQLIAVVIWNPSSLTTTAMGYVTVSAFIEPLGIGSIGSSTVLDSFLFLFLFFIFLALFLL